MANRLVQCDPCRGHRLYPSAADFDYVLLDICMENSLTGTETLRRLKSVDPDAQVILASGRLPEEIAPQDLALAHGHLLKPFTFESLAALLKIPVPA